MKKKKNKKKKKTLSQEEKNNIDWINKWGKGGGYAQKEKTNKVPDKAPDDVAQKFWNVVGPIIWIIVLIGLASAIFDLGSSGFKKGAKYLDNRDNKKEECIDETRNIENEFTAKKLYKACMKRWKRKIKKKE